MTGLPPGLKRSCADASHLFLAAASTPVYGQDEAAKWRWLPQSLSKGAAGIALAHAVHADTDRTDQWLARAVAGGITVGDGSGLWFGAPAVAFAAAAANPGRYRTALDCLDGPLARLIRARLTAACARIKAHARPALAEFDLVNGLTGLGAYLLTRDPGGPLLRDILTYLVRLTAPIPADDNGVDLPGWWSDDAPSRESPLRGHGNLGMAHGIAGPLALLSLAARRGITVPGHTTAIDRITDWLDTWQQNGPAGAWWPKYVRLDDVRFGRTAQTSPGRPSWCYGTPGISRALQLAAIARGDRTRQESAEQALTRCVTDPVQLTELTDPYLCHGWAGAAATVWYAAADACTPDLPATVGRLAAAFLDATTPTADQPPGLINGSAGIAVTLRTLTSGTTWPWSACLLLN